MDPESAATRVEQHYEQAREVLPGGVTASARVNAALGRPVVFARGEGARLYDLDGREYLDFATSFGASLLGHGHPAVKAAIVEAVERGILCAHEVPEQAEVARKLVELVPSAEL